MTASRIVVVALATVGGIVVACGGNGDTAKKMIDAPAPPIDACAGGSTACSDPCNIGNDKGVGRYCTMGHSECNMNKAPFIFCTKDYEPDEDVSYCTGPCSGDADCGQNAYCSGSGSGGRGCVPMVCGGTPSLDAGIDAGHPDA